MLCWVAKKPPSSLSYSSPVNKARLCAVILWILRLGKKKILFVMVFQISSRGLVLILLIWPLRHQSLSFPRLPLNHRSPISQVTRDHSGTGVNLLTLISFEASTFSNCKEIIGTAVRVLTDKYQSRLSQGLYEVRIKGLQPNYQCSTIVKSTELDIYINNYICPTGFSKLCQMGTNVTSIV